MLNSKIYISIKLPAQWAVSITTGCTAGSLTACRLRTFVRRFFFLTFLPIYFYRFYEPVFSYFTRGVKPRLFHFENLAWTDFQNIPFFSYKFLQPFLLPSPKVQFHSFQQAWLAELLYFLIDMIQLNLHFQVM